MSAFAKYCRVLRRVKNRNAALQADLRRIADLSSRSEPSQQPTLHSRMDRGATRALDDRVRGDAAGVRGGGGARAAQEGRGDRGGAVGR